MAEEKAMSEFLPFSRPAMGVEELAAVKEVLESGWITTGPKNQALEQAFCQLTEISMPSRSVQPPPECISR